MTDLIWIGNSLYPRWMVFLALAVAVLGASGVMAIAIAAITRKKA